ncbi:MAG: hypothetical protein Q7R93_05145 [bacterium]|nr:hypothetical protein [bacterium]
MKNRKTILPFIAFTVGIALVIFSFWFLLFPLPKTTPKRQENARTNSVLSVYSMQEMQVFSAQNIEPMLSEALPKGQFRIPEIQQRFTTLRQQCFERYTNDIVFEMAIHYQGKSRDVLAGCLIKNGVPTVQLRVPAIMDVFGEMKRENGSERFEYTLLILTIHELDHLAHGYVSKGLTQSFTFTNFIANEKKTWALTCEHTIRPLLEKYDAPLSFSERVYYEQWTNANRDVNHPGWETFIRSYYQKTQ